MTMSKAENQRMIDALGEVERLKKKIDDERREAFNDRQSLQGTIHKQTEQIKAMSEQAMAQQETIRHLTGKVSLLTGYSNALQGLDPAGNPRDAGPADRETTYPHY